MYRYRFDITGANGYERSKSILYFSMITPGSSNLAIGTITLNGYNHSNSTARSVSISSSGVSVTDIAFGFQMTVTIVIYY